MENTMIIREDEVEEILHSLEMRITPERMTVLRGVIHKLFKDSSYDVRIIQKFTGQETLKNYEVEDYLREYREKVLYNEVRRDRETPTPNFDIHAGYFMINNYNGKIWLYKREGSEYNRKSTYCLVHKEHTKDNHYSSLLIQQIITEYKLLECTTPEERERLVYCLAHIYDTNIWPSSSMYHKIKLQYGDEYPNVFDREIKVLIFKQTLSKIAHPHTWYERDEYPDLDEVRKQAREALTKKEFIPEEPIITAEKTGEE